MIIGITGTLGAGKGTTAEYLAKEHGFSYLSVRNFIASEVSRRGLIVSRESLLKVGNDLRAEHSASWLVEQLLDQALSQTKAFGQHNIVIESIRAVGEAQLLRSRGARLWSLDADPNTRYSRTVKYVGARNALTFEQFMANEREETLTTKANETNLTETMKLADATIINNGSFEELYAKIEIALQNALAPIA